jgi:hypothetical protein
MDRSDDATILNSQRWCRPTHEVAAGTGPLLPGAVSCHCEPMSGGSPVGKRHVTIKTKPPMVVS